MLITHYHTCAVNQHDECRFEVSHVAWAVQPDDVTATAIGTLPLTH